VERAPPTGPAPLLALADLLASMRADRTMEDVLEGARLAGAKVSDIATTKARFERRRGRPDAALRALEPVAGERSAAQSLERAAAFLDLDRAEEALSELSRFDADPGSRVWLEAVKLRAMIQGRSNGFPAADRVLQGALQECGDIGGAAQAIRLWRVEIGLELGLPQASIETLLRDVPVYPATPETAYYNGRAAEQAGNHEAARRAYNEALRIDEAHVPSLERLIELEPGQPHRQRLGELLAPNDARAR